MRKLILIFLLLPFFVNAQELNFAQADSTSYALYMANDFNKLQQTGEDVLKKGLDFYDLRVRLGVSYLLQKKYERALVHFNRALEMNPSEDYVLNDTYFCLMMTAQYQRANALLVKYPQIKSTLKPKKSGLANVELEAGSVFSNNATQFEGKNLEANGTNYGQGNFFAGMNYLRAYTEGLFTPEVRWHFGINMFQTQHLAKLDFFDKHFESNNSSLNLQLNLGTTKLFENGWCSGFGIGYYRQSFSYPYLNTSTNPPPPNTSISDSTEYSNAVSISIFTSKRMKFVEPVLFFNYGNFNNLTRLQFEGGITCFPLGRDQLYSYTSFSYINSNSVSASAFNQKIGYNIIPAITLEGNFLKGSLDNYMGSMGFLTLNTFDPLKWSAGLDLSFHIKKFTVSPGYRYQKRETSYTFEKSLGNSVRKTYTYYNHLLFITLKCQF